MSMAASRHLYQNPAYPRTGRLSPPDEYHSGGTLDSTPLSPRSEPSLPYYHQQHSPQPPPSPPMDHAPRYSLPSISSLLNYSGGRGDDWSKREYSRDVRSPYEVDPRLEEHQSPSQHSPGRGHNPNLGLHDREQPTSDHSYTRTQFPPTPPTGVNPYDKVGSPLLTQTSRHTAHNENGPYFVEPRHRRQSLSSNGSSRRDYQGHETSTTPYPAPPAQYGEPNHRGLRVNPPVYPVSTQRPLPTDFPPQPVSTAPPQRQPASTSPTSPPASNVSWQQQQYPQSQSTPNSATTPSSFSPTQDRYICPTCSKAFSRPSSLRIHSHSHTGEKPFKCPHRGCGKAFSVRSNMKRHERGCHVDRRNDLSIAGRGRELLPAAG